MIHIFSGNLQLEKIKAPMEVPFCVVLSGWSTRMIMLTERGVIVQGYREVFMKKWWILAGILVLLGGCSQVEHKSAEMEREETPPLDPAVEVEGIEAFARLGADIDVPAGAENAKYYIISDRIAEIQFSQNGVQYSYRASQMDEATGVQGEPQEVEDVQAVAGSQVIPIQKMDSGYVALWKWGELTYSLIAEDSADVGMVRSLAEELARETMPAVL